MRRVLASALLAIVAMFASTAEAQWGYYQGYYQGPSYSPYWQWYSGPTYYYGQPYYSSPWYVVPHGDHWHVVPGYWY
jgi:hypothetical protein